MTSRNPVVVIDGQLCQLPDGDVLDHHARTDRGQTFTGAQRTLITALTDGATIAIDLSQSNTFQVELSGNHMIANPTGMPLDGETQSGVLFLAQDATGSRVVTWGSSWDFGADGPPVLSTAANVIDMICYTVYSPTCIMARLCVKGSSGSHQLYTWVQQARLSASDGGTNHYFGGSTASTTDGNVVAIGAVYATVGGITQAGAVYVYTRTAGIWSQSQKLVASDPASLTNFGQEVAISDDEQTMIIGSTKATASGLSEAGAAYIFTQSNGTWVQQARLTASVPIASANFGRSIHISGDGNTVIVGAYTESNAWGTYAGAAYIFTRSGSTWTQQAKLDDTVINRSNARFGVNARLSADGNTALVSAFTWSNGGTERGAAFVYTRSGSTWSLQASLLASDAANYARFGNSISLSADGNTALIGAELGDSGNQGACYVFTRSGSTWTQVQKPLASDGAAGDQFGHSVGLSRDAAQAVVTACYDDSQTGSAYVFNRSGGTYVQLQKLTASDAAVNDRFGNNAAMFSGDGNTLFIGAAFDNFGAGSTYVFVKQ